MRLDQTFRLVICLLLGTAGVAVRDAAASTEGTWQPQPFERYAGILERMPFGKPPVGPTAAETAAAEAAKTPPPPFVNQLVLCALNRTPAGGLAVGFMDNSQKPPKSYYLEKGETNDNFTVLSANFELECATIEKDGIDVDLKMGKGATLATGRPTPTPMPVALPALRPMPRSVLTLTNDTNAIAARLAGGPPMPMRSFNPAQPDTWRVPNSVKAIDKALTMGIQEESYVERLKKRREELLAQQAEQTSSAQATVDNAVEERTVRGIEHSIRMMNMESIRSGGGGLGIVLTPEEDAQLVSEGVLPAAK